MSYKPSQSLKPLIKKTLIVMSSLSLLSGTLVIAQESSESSSETAPAPKANNPAPQLSAPTVSVPVQPPANAADLIPAPQPVVTPQVQPKVVIQQNHNNPYIDPTPYNSQPKPSVQFETRNEVSNTNKPSLNSQPKPQSLNHNSSNYTPNSQEKHTYTRKNQAYQPVNNFNKLNSNNYQPTIIEAHNYKALSEPPVYNRSTRVIKNYTPVNTSLIFPLSIPAPITSAFGFRVHPISGSSRFHAGTDIGAPYGTPVLAAYEGRVDNAGGLGGYGLAVTIRHENSTQESLYGHLSEIYVQPGQWVEQGTVIGLVGSTGYSTGPHLHFEWRHLTNSGWVAVDAGDHLQMAMEALIKSMEVASASNVNRPN
jgi:murein DD-endopeptidase MepM/ murein hydrolase activator NlpD